MKKYLSNIKKSLSNIAQLPLWLEQLRCHRRSYLIWRLDVSFLLVVGILFFLSSFWPSCCSFHGRHWQNIEDYQWFVTGAIVLAVGLPLLSNLPRLVRQKPFFHRRIIRLMGWVHGGTASRFLVFCIVGVGTAWLAVGLPAIWSSTEVSNLMFFERGLETLYRLLTTLTPDNYWFSFLRGGDAVPFYLNLTRFLGTSLTLLIGVPPLLRWALKRAERNIPRYWLSDHWVVLGFGRVGEALVMDLLTRRKKSDLRAVVIVDVGGEAATLEWARRHGAIVRIADATNEEEFVATAISRAKGVLVATGTESRNIDITARVTRSVWAEPKPSLSEPKPSLSEPKPSLSEPKPSLSESEPKLRIVPHINDPSLLAWAESDDGYRRLHGGAIGEGQRLGNAPVHVLPFCSNRTAVRQLLTRRPIAEYAALRPVERAHFVILGYDEISQWLIVHLLQVGRMKGLKGPRITLVVDGDESVKGRVSAALFRRYPVLDPESAEHTEMREYLDIDFAVSCYDFSYIDESIFSTVQTAFASDDSAAPEPRDAGGTSGIEKANAWLTGMKMVPNNPSAAIEEIIKHEAVDRGDPVTGIFICLKTDDRNLNVAMELQGLIRAHRRWQAPTFLRLIRESGLDRRRNRSDRQTDLAEVMEEFGQDSTVCSHDEIFDPPRDRAATDAHMEYEIGSRASALGTALAKAEKQQQPPEVPDGDREPPEPHELTDEEKAGMVIDEGRLPSLEQISNWLSDRLGNPESSSGGFELKRAYEAFSDLEPLLNALRDRAHEPNRARDSSLGDIAWKDLPPHFATSNRDKVDHIPTKMMGIGFRACVDTSGKKGKSRVSGKWPARSMTEIYLEELKAAYCEEKGCAFSDLAAEDNSWESRLIADNATLEHQRWCTERLMSGWRWGATRNNLLRLHHLIRPHEGLPASEKRKDERSTANLKVLAREITLDDQPRVWTPEYRVGCIGPSELNAEQIKELEAHLPKVLSFLVETENVCRQAKPHPDPADRPGLCFVSTLGGGAPVHMAAIARGWANGDTKDKSKDSKHRYRFVVPRPIPLPLNPESSEPGLKPEDAKARAELLAKPDDFDKNFSDWWTIDLLPEGVSLGAIDGRKFPNCAPPDLQKSWEPGSQWLPADLEASGVDNKNGEIGSPEAASREKAKEFIQKLRQELREKLLLPRATAYIVERSDWLVVVRISGHDTDSKGNDDVSRAIEWRCKLEEIPARFTSLPGERRSLLDFLPSISETTKKVSDALAEFSDPEISVEPVFEHRLVVIDLGRKD